jgi:hypothetical protein
MRLPPSTEIYRDRQIDLGINGRIIKIDLTETGCEGVGCKGVGTSGWLY